MKTKRASAGNIKATPRLACAFYDIWHFFGRKFSKLALYFSGFASRSLKWVSLG
jgi:hypothetical protein